MLKFLFGVIVGANVSLILYAIIIVGARSEAKDEWWKQNWLLCDYSSDSLI